MYRAAIQVAPAHEAALVNYAHLNVEDKNLELAETLYKKALQLNPSHILALCNYAALLIKISGAGKGWGGLPAGEVERKEGEEGDAQVCTDVEGVRGTGDGARAPSEDQSFFSANLPSRRHALEEALTLLKRAKDLQVCVRARVCV